VPAALLHSLSYQTSSLSPGDLFNYKLINNASAASVNLMFLYMEYQ